MGRIFNFYHTLSLERTARESLIWDDRHAGGYPEAILLFGVKAANRRTACLDRAPRNERKILLSDLEGFQFALAQPVASMQASAVLGQHIRPHLFTPIRNCQPPRTPSASAGYPKRQDRIAYPYSEKNAQPPVPTALPLVRQGLQGGRDSLFDQRITKRPSWGLQDPQSCVRIPRVSLSDLGAMAVRNFGSE